MLNEDKQLLEQIAGGDVKALGILYVLYAGRIRNFAFSMLQNSSEAEDITQDMFLKIWNSREALREVDSLKSYLFSMAHNAVLNFIKRKGVRDRYQKATVGVSTERYEPSFQMDTFELLKSIDEALEDMSVLRKTIFRMNRYEHKTYQEIADILMESPAFTLKYSPSTFFILLSTSTISILLFMSIAFPSTSCSVSPRDLIYLL